MKCDHRGMGDTDKFCPACGMPQERVDRGETGIVPAESEFPALRMMIGILRMIAWLGVIAGGILAVVSLLLPLRDAPPAVAAYADYGRATLLVVAILFGFLTWLYAMIQAELIQVLLAVEEHTRRIAEKA